MSDDTQDLYEDEEHRGRGTRTALIAILVLLILMLAGLGYFINEVITPAGVPRGSKATPVGLEWVRSLYGFGPKSADMFFRPLDAAIAPDGTIYGTDPQRGRILSFSPDGTFRALVQTGAPAKGDGRMMRPDRVTTDEDGNLYVAENANEKIMVFSPEGKLLREWPVPRPTAIAVSGQRVYVATVYGIATFKVDGTLLATWGRRGNGPEEFDNPHGVVVGGDGTVYVADTLNARLKAYTPEGKLKWIWPADRSTAKKSGIRPSETGSPFQIPTGMCIDGRGRLVLVDPFAYQIVVLQLEAKGARIVGRYGDSGTADGFFAYPDGISYDRARDWFAVADSYNDRVQIVRIPGSTSNAPLAAIRRAATGPVWLCTLPLLLLLIAVIVALARRRGRRAMANEDDEEGTSSA